MLLILSPIISISLLIESLICFKESIFIKKFDIYSGFIPFLFSSEVNISASTLCKKIL